MYQFCNGDIDKFVLLQRKGFYPYEYMDSWERSNETSLPDKSIFYSELNLEDITDRKTSVIVMTCMFYVYIIDC